MRASIKILPAGPGCREGASRTPRGEPGSPDKRRPPVFGTAVPPRGLSGAIRLLAYQLPDHSPSHWLLLMFGDRVDSWGYRMRRLLPVALPLAALGLLVRFARR